MAVLRHPWGRILAVWIAGALCLYSEDIRKDSLTSADAARKKEERSNYNLRIGSIKVRTKASAGMEFNDNVNLQPYSSSARMSDFIFRPGFGVDLIWPATDLNELTFTFGGSYAKYLFHPELDIDTIMISPDSAIEFLLYIKDWKFKFYDRFSYQTDPVPSSDISGKASFERLMNDVGVNADWDLNQVIVSVLVQNSLLMPMTQDFEAVERQTNTLGVAPKFLISPTVGIGLNTQVSATDYVKNIQNDGINYQAGPFVEMALSELTKIRVESGYQMFDFESNGSEGGQSSYSSVYSALAAQNRMNKYFDHELKFFRQADLAIGSNFSEKMGVDYGVNWKCLNYLNLQTGAFWEGFSTSGRRAENGNRFGLKARVSSQMTKSIILGLDYRVTMKESSLPENDYLQNITAVTMSYRF